MERMQHDGQARRLLTTPRRSSQRAPTMSTPTRTAHANTSTTLYPLTSDQRRQNRQRCATRLRHHCCQLSA